MVTLTDFLDGAGVPLETTLVMRHRPTEPEFRRALPWLAAEHQDVFNAYQQFQPPRVEGQLLKATHLVSFIGDQPGRGVLVGLYANRGHRMTTAKQRAALPGYQGLLQFGVGSWPGRSHMFDLKLMDALSSLMGRLIVNWPPPDRSWSRWASQNTFEMQALLEDSLFTSDIPNWRELVLSWNELQSIPQNWRRTIAEWRGIYFILDQSDGKGYVGAAYGRENLLGRWQDYAKTGHGDNKLLKTRKPENLSFSILERVSPDMPAEDIIALEAQWKQRLHTRGHGLNAN